MIRKDFHEGIGYSVVEFDGLRQIFATALPCCGDTFAEQAEEVLESLKTIFHKEGAEASVVMQTVFLHHLANQADCRRMMREFYGKDLPATAYVVQPPCDGNLLSIEAWGLKGSKDQLGIERAGEMVLARHRGMTWAYLSNIRGETVADSVYARSVSAFHSACVRLSDAGLHFDDVVRTWLYLGNITGAERHTTRYLELNRARTDFYRDRTFLAGLLPKEWKRPVFPASTGIGMKGNEVAIGGIAIQSERPDVVLFPLENPKQTAAYDYAHEYGPDSPKFARAMALVAGESVTTFVSGTASITASDTRHADNFERQTQQTLDNIEVLISPDNFRQHGFPGMGAKLDDLALARVYLKRPEDYPQARAICQDRLGKLPTIYVVGDICRPELLVEIEAVAFSRRKS
jgi:enamine deaminase RidA (YjgF/YER057c/UK114 family)